MLTFTTERLLIRNFSLSDTMDLHTMIQEFERSEYSQYDHQWPGSFAEIEKIIAWFSQNDNYLAVCLKENHEFIGFVSLLKENTKSDNAFSLGYHFMTKHHGNGYATEACKTIIAYAFNERNAGRIVTGTAFLNIPSCNLLKRLGFKKTGEGKVSLQKDAKGMPIEFMGNEFTLTQADYDVINI